MARAKVPRAIFDYIAGGAEDEVTLRRNREAFGRWALRPRVLRDVRNAFTLPPGFGIANLKPAGLDGMPEVEQGSAFAQYVTDLLDSSLTWDDVDWLKSISPLPLVVKGIMTAEDAVLAVDHGIAGIVVSNHGGRQLDSTLGSLDALPEVVAAVRGRIEVYLDGGIRRGTDVLKALALGAKAVFVGRPVLWGLALGGADGVRAVLDELRTELDTAMALAGCATLKDIESSLVLRAG